MLASTSYTFLIRVECLERPSLVPAVVGYSVLKLCTDKFGNQPHSTSTDTSGVLLNSGLFKLPLYFGSLTWSNNQNLFTEFNVQTSLDILPDAYVYVRLYDSTIDKPSPFVFDPMATPNE